MNKHEYYMRQALTESRKAAVHSSPNPPVGAVLVKNNRIIGQGHTQVPGQAHAEVMAIQQAGPAAKGASLYVTLEPCCHFGRTSPCTDLIIRKGIKEVFIGMDDPNPLVCGNGCRLLKKKGLCVVRGVLKEKIGEELEWYIKWIKKGLPYVTLKAGLSLDGKLTDYRGDSRWITSKKARLYGQRLREVHDAILTGINTVVKDDPLLSYRGRNRKKAFFYRVILDTSLRISIRAKVLRPLPSHHTLIAIGSGVKDRKKLEHIRGLKDVTILECPVREKKVDLGFVLKALAERDVTRLLVEGGSEVFYSFLSRGLADKLVLFMAPLLLGGAVSAKGFIGGRGFLLDHAVRIRKGRFFNFLPDNSVYEGYLNVYRDH
ncbi:MAG: bifunctional diaminohydroxyphosphoribosylaminopyrimidine deaminase/5-amino-6-(5-phosphoribosylamino)uracil reductase RibD [bacterium]|nr:bifunctional diaminohydroxyphosphoribosylaminopyrimidine deaminase/5-amino-6-(5-phosphoribosylamino)uracil reductase RibD [bacterium]